MPGSESEVPSVMDRIVANQKLILDKLELIFAEKEKKAYAEAWRDGVKAARSYLRRMWDDKAQGNLDDSAELLLLDDMAERGPPEK